MVVGSIQIDRVRSARALSLHNEWTGRTTHHVVVYVDAEARQVAGRLIGSMTFREDQLWIPCPTAEAAEALATAMRSALGLGHDVELAEAAE